MSWKTAPPPGLLRLRAGQRIDAKPAREIRVGPDALDHHHAALQPVEQPGMQQQIVAWLVADLDRAAFGRCRASSHPRDGSARSAAARATARARRLGEGGVQELPRRRRQPGGTDGRHWPPRSLAEMSGRSVMPLTSVPIVAQLAWKWNFLSAWPKPSRKCAVSNSGMQSCQCLA